MPKPFQQQIEKAREAELAHLRAELAATRSRLLDMVARFSPQPSTATIDELLTLIENNGAAVVARMSEAEAEVAEKQTRNEELAGQNFNLRAQLAQREAGIPSALTLFNRLELTREEVQVALQAARGGKA
jgi:hypothetical protein